jgi:hypothetical protein
MQDSSMTLQLPDGCTQDLVPDRIQASASVVQQVLDPDQFALSSHSSLQTSSLDRPCTQSFTPNQPTSTFMLLQTIW